MHRRNPQSTRAFVATMAAVVVLSGCREKATTGPSRVEAKDFASALRSVSGDQQIGPVGAALTQQLAVKVVDAGGLPVEGATVSFSVRAGGGNVNPAANTSAANGLVYGVWTLGTSLGAQKVVAILTNNFVLDSVSFTATATTGTAATLTLVSGNSQTGRAGRQLAQPLVVKVADSFGYVKSGVRVTWTPGGQSGTLTPLSDTTAADGTAGANWKLGTVVLPQTAVASVAGLPVVQFSASTTPDTGRLVDQVAGSGQTGPVSVALPLQLTVRVTDQYGNVIAGEPISWTDSIVGGGTVSNVSSITGANGTASITWSLGNRAGAQFLRAKATAFGGTVGFNASATVAFSSVLAGNFTACGIAASNNRIYCWGQNDAGQVGKGTFQNTAAPTTPVASAADSSATAPYLHARQLSGGRSSYCALTTAQQMYCWGRAWGGTGTSAVANLLTINAGGNAPIAINFIAVGEDHACASDLAGRAFCTGVNQEGQVGDGTLNTPAANLWMFVALPPSPFALSAISSGSSHTCGMPIFNPTPLSNSQVPWCWGLNNSGQSGNPLSYAPVRPPAQITMPLGLGAPTAFDSASLTAGHQHTCAMTPAGAGYCWGLNAHGQLGRGNAVSASSRDSIPQAVAMPAGVLFAKMFAGKYHTCALSTTGAAYCWGRDDYGQLGDGVRMGFNTGNPTPQPVAAGLSFRSLSLGELYTCGVVADINSPTGPSAQAGTIYCWGDNVFGQIGNGQASGGNAPVMFPTRVAFQP